MNKPNQEVYEYECDQCHDRFEAVTTFRKSTPHDRDAQGNWHPDGYTEEQPCCPTCHSHEVAKVEIHKTDKG